MRSSCSGHARFSRAVCGIDAEGTGNYKTYKLPLGNDEALASGRALGASRAVLAWIERTVVKQGLCPWATRSLSSCDDRVLEIRVFSSADQLERAVALEARLLLPNECVRPTTLLVLERCVDVGSFANLTRRAAASLASARLEVDLLAFHPHRIDTGPGCSANTSDAAHFSVRAPLPTLQLLRQEELQRARAEWAETHGSGLPGALGMLNENKDRLRAIGSPTLAQMLADCREIKQARSGES